MSLINDMLKDLEKRRGRDNDMSSGNASLERLSSVGHNRGKRRLLSRLFIFIVIIVIITGIFWTFFHKKKPLPQKAITPVSAVDKKEDVTTVVASGKPTPEIIVVDSMQTEASLTSISVTQENGQTLLQLNLTRSVHYQLHVSPDHELLTLMLSNTKLEEPLSELQNAIIKKVQFKKGLNNDLFLMFSVEPGTEVKSLAMSEKKPYQLVMTLINKGVLGDQLVKKSEVPLTPVQLAESSYVRALKLIDKNDLTQAKKVLAESIALAPDFIPARKTLVTLFITEKDYRQADILLQEGLKHAPYSIELVKLYAQILVAEHRLQSALRVLQRLSPDFDENPEYYAFIAALQQQLGHPVIAEHMYGKLLKLESRGIWWMGLGIALESSGKTNAALNAYSHAASSGELEPSVEAYVKAKISQMGS